MLTLLLSTLAKSLLANVPNDVLALQLILTKSSFENVEQEVWRGQSEPAAWFVCFQLEHRKLQLLHLTIKENVPQTEVLDLFTSRLSDVSLIFLAFISCIDLPFITPPCKCWSLRSNPTESPPPWFW